MNDKLEAMVTYLSGPSQIERDIVRKHIAVLDSIDSRFSNVASRLVTESQSSPAENFVRIMLGKWITDRKSFESALYMTMNRKRQFGENYSTPLLVLEDAIAANSVGSMEVPDGQDRYSMIQAASAGDFHLVSLNLITRPDLMEISGKDLNDYYHPLAVAGALLDINTDERRFIDEAPAFLAWVAEQENIDVTLAAALQAKSLDPNTIEAIADMRHATPSPLHSGLI